MQDLTNEEFKLYQQQIYKLAGIHYSPEKRGLLGNRVKRRLRALGLTDYTAYLRKLRNPKDREVQEFLNSVTTNETYFFRCQRHWDYFTNVLREWKASRRGRKGTFRVWSAASSNGSEAYTILICAHKVLGDNFGGHKVEVVGTDLNDAVVAEARAAHYGRYAIGQMKKGDINTYFTKEGETFIFDPKLARNATFKRHNLMEPLREPPFDTIFIRNVMIYFDRPAKEKVVRHAAAVLKPGCSLIVGESESLLSVDHELEYVKPSIFAKTTPTPSSSTT